jgi:hypothetical protein
MVDSGERGQPATRYCYICRSTTHISPDCPFMIDKEREEIAKRREVALAEGSRMAHFRPTPAWLIRERRLPLVEAREARPSIHFGERHNIGTDQKT